MSDQIKYLIYRLTNMAEAGPLAFDAAIIREAIAALSAREGGEAGKFTTGHCESHKKPGGCTAPNVHCGWPECDRRPIPAQPASQQPHPTGDRVRAYVEEAAGCISAAFVEGWPDALAEGNIERIRDLWERRMSFALPALEAALDQEKGR
jgi:hypothetical protein